MKREPLPARRAADDERPRCPAQRAPAASWRRAGGPQPARPPGGREELERHVEERVLTTTLDKTVAWARSNSFFPLAFGLACCAMEQFHAAGPRMDIARFGFEAFRASPRQADLIILAGRVSIKMAPIIRRLYDQMLEPKWAISMGACCSSMGVFNNYALVPADKFMPVDVHVPGCPPRPEALMHGILKLRKLVQDDPDMGWRERYEAVGTEEVLPSPEPRTRARRVRAARGGTPCLTPPASSYRPRAAGGQSSAHGLGRSTRSTSADGHAGDRARAHPPGARDLREKGIRVPGSVHGVDHYPRGAATRRGLRAARHEPRRPHHREAARARPTIRSSTRCPDGGRAGGRRPTIRSARSTTCSGSSSAGTPTCGAS